MLFLTFVHFSDGAFSFYHVPNLVKLPLYEDRPVGLLPANVRRRRSRACHADCWPLGQCWRVGFEGFRVKKSSSPPHPWHPADIHSPQRALLLSRTDAASLNATTRLQEFFRCQAATVGVGFP